MRAERHTNWALSFILAIVFLADTYGILKYQWGLNLPFSHEGLAIPAWKVFWLQVCALAFVNLLFLRLRSFRIQAHHFSYLPKEWRKYWNRDGVRRELFRSNFRRVLRPTVTMLNSFVIVLNYISVRYPAPSISDRLFNRWTLFLVIIILVFIIQMMREIRPPMRATGIRFT